MSSLICECQQKTHTYTDIFGDQKKSITDACLCILLLYYITLVETMVISIKQLLPSPPVLQTTQLPLSIRQASIFTFM